MGIGTMDELGIDQSRTDKMITWGPNIEVPMVPMGYWTDTRVQSLCKQPNSEKEHAEAAVDEANLFSTTETPAASFKKAVYKMPDLLEVAKRNGAKLTPVQQAMLLNNLVKNDNLFKGGCSSYNGKPVGIKVKDDAIPFRAKPYLIPLKSREILEHKVAQQCLIGCLS
jgi:hypothetical protein